MSTKTSISITDDLQSRMDRLVKRPETVGKHIRSIIYMCEAQKSLLTGESIKGLIKKDSAKNH